MTEIDELIAKSGMGRGLANIGENGIDAEMAVLEQEMAPKKRATKPTSPTARTLAELRKRGETAQVVERWNKFAKKRIDLFGVIDIVVIRSALHGKRLGIVGVQATTGENHSHRREKMLAEGRAREWIAAGGQLEIWSWSQRVAYKMDGTKRAMRSWTLRVETYEEMLASREGSP